VEHRYQLIGASRVNDRELMQALLDSPSSHAIVVTDLNGKVTFWNRGAMRIFGYSAEEITGADANVLFVPDDRERGVARLEMRRALKDGCAGDFRWHLRKNGERFWGDGMMYPVLSERGVHFGYMKILRDATEEKLRDDEHERLAYVDSLTGLPNRAELYRRLVDMTAAAQRHDELLFVHLVDLDHFKEVNDRFGHPGGDTLLREVAERMRGELRDTDLLVRLGGDEFAILQPGGHVMEDAAVVAEKLLEVLARPVDIDDDQAEISASIGISVYPDGGTHMEELMRNADSALYKAKAEGRNRYAFFEDGHGDAPPPDGRSCSTPLSG
jgi:diguanylate cyclase (GGDEF)-like protein/PAS domain S-box-containing protein